MILTHRKARRRLGSRSTRRAGGNGKVLPGTGGGGNKRCMCVRNPKPPKNLGWRVRNLVEASRVQGQA